MEIKINYSEDCGCQVIADGEIILECLGEDEVKELTVGEIFEIRNRLYEK